MNARERNLLIGLIVILGGGALLYAGNRWFLNPLQEYNATIAKLTEDNQTEQAKLALFEAEKKKLVVARLKSLPNNSADAIAEYMNYLKPLLEGSGLVGVDLKPGTAQDVKPLAANSSSNAKKPGHRLITFTVHAGGELSQVVKAIDLMRKTPFEHRIKNLTIDRKETSTAKSASTKLNILMSVETLLVAKTQSKPGMIPGFDPKSYLVYDQVAGRGFGPTGWGTLAATVMHLQATRTYADRDYADIGRKNIFVGAIPLPPEKEKKGLLKPNVDVPKYVHLIHLAPKEQTAYLHNRVYKKDDIKVMVQPKADVFTIIDDETGFRFFNAKLMKVESREIYFQVKDNVYQMHIGQSLSEAMARPLAIDLELLEVEGLFDSAWAERELAAEKNGPTTKKGRFGR
jgi:hypothetical protein